MAKKKRSTYKRYRVARCQPIWAVKKVWGIYDHDRGGDNPAWTGLACEDRADLVEVAQMMNEWEHNEVGLGNREGE